MLTASQQRRLLTTNSTAAASVLSAKRWTEATLTSALSNWKDLVVPMGQIGGNRIRYAELSFMGIGSNDQTGSCYVWQLKRGQIGTNQFNDIELVYLGLAGFTLSTLVGAGTGLTVDTLERIADTVTWTPGTTATTPKGMGTIVEAAYGGAAGAVYSPTDNTPGRLFLPEIGNGDLLLEMVKGTATSVNAVVEVGR